MLSILSIKCDKRLQTKKIYEKIFYFVFKFFHNNKDNVYNGSTDADDPGSTDGDVSGSCEDEDCVIGVRRTVVGLPLEELGETSIGVSVVGSSGQVGQLHPVGVVPGQVTGGAVGHNGSVSKQAGTISPSLMHSCLG